LTMNYLEGERPGRGHKWVLFSNYRGQEERKQNDSHPYFLSGLHAVFLKIPGESPISEQFCLNEKSRQRAVYYFCVGVSSPAPLVILTGEAGWFQGLLGGKLTFTASPQAVHRCTGALVHFLNLLVPPTCPP